MVRTCQQTKKKKRKKGRIKERNVQVRLHSYLTHFSFGLHEWPNTKRRVGAVLSNRLPLVEDARRDRASVERGRDKGEFEKYMGDKNGNMSQLLHY